MNILLHWSPRILALLFVGLLSLFAFDVFTRPWSPMMIGGFLVHLLPSLGLLTLTLIAWRYPLVGAIAFLGFSLWYVWSVGLGQPWSWYALIAAPAALVGVLFLADWWRTRRIT